MKNRRIVVTLSLGIIVILFCGTFILQSSAAPVSEEQLWRSTRQTVAEIEKQKAIDILEERTMTDGEREVLAQAQKEEAAVVFEDEKKVATARYWELQELVTELEAESRRRSLAEEEQLELINLRDEALDLSLRYELFRTVTEEEELRSTISTLISQETYLEGFYKELKTAKPEHVASCEAQIFMAGSYAALGKEAQLMWDEGASIEEVRAYIDTQTELTCADSMEIGLGNMQIER